MTALVSPSMEDYVGKIWRLIQYGGSATTSEVARKLGVTPASVSSMFKKLADAGLVEYREYSGVTLTALGRAAAMKSVRRHRLIERFLVDILDIPWDEVDAIADPAEHVLPDLVVNQMEKVLGKPTMCPHGYPIPDQEGVMEERSVRLVANMAAGESGVIERVAEYDPETLRYMATHKLVPGEKITVTARDEIAGTMTVEVDRTSLVLGLPIARQLWITLNPSQETNRLGNDKGDG